MYQIDFHKPLHIHFIGIGGISMSGLAEILLEENFRISGSDAKSSPLTRTLEERGAVIYYGQRASNIKDDVDVVVYTAAIHPDNPEFACAKEKGFQCSPAQSFWDRSCGTTIHRSQFPEPTEKPLLLPWFPISFLRVTVILPSVLAESFLLSTETSALEILRPLSQRHANTPTAF